MYYSEKDFVDYAMSRPHILHYELERTGLPRSRKTFALIHKEAMKNIEERNPAGRIGVWKWYRPWSVVPALREFQAPAGDFGVGIEIELGFNTLRDAQAVASKVKNWRHITLDFEGGTYPIEATFPPTLYSKFGPRSQACRYLKLVKELGEVRDHGRGDSVGTHINVSVGGRGHRDRSIRRNHVNRIIEYGYESFTTNMMQKYFGRMPYGGIRSCVTHYECKMFNSVTDWKVLRRYVDISVELVKLIESDDAINLDSVVAACERGYTLRS